MNMKRRYRTLTKAVIIPSGFFVRILRSFIPSERSISGQSLSKTENGSRTE
ncbi:hypothetical protein [Fictibacillus sp. FJAT-27399]|uniref:hypothetical protein n=1 Tax=Fictibacillus sp. FJAT-27399 TaxID=1729689 RepID=UPI000A632A84|nr:hypothetical protein [Fictibacillus sp. FJAT-27399]